MARALVIEEEAGTRRGRVHPHNGYYAGAFPAPRTVPFQNTPSAATRDLHVVRGFAGPPATPAASRSSDRPSLIGQTPMPSALADLLGAAARR
jgi:hypothetical protein